MLSLEPSPNSRSGRSGSLSPGPGRETRNILPAVSGGRRIRLGFPLFSASPCENEKFRTLCFSSGEMGCQLARYLHKREVLTIWERCVNVEHFLPCGVQKLGFLPCSSGDVDGDKIIFKSGQPFLPPRSHRLGWLGREWCEGLLVHPRRQLL